MLSFCFYSATFISRPKHVALMRELQLVAELQDASAPCGLVLVFPMLGQAAPVRGLLQRYHAPECSLSKLEAEKETRNARVLESIRASNDTELDKAAFAKSLDEQALGVLNRRVASSTICYPGISIVPWSASLPIARPTWMRWQHRSVRFLTASPSGQSKVGPAVVQGIQTSAGRSRPVPLRCGCAVVSLPLRTRLVDRTHQLFGWM